jgi:hypothetical protein
VHIVIAGHVLAGCDRPLIDRNEGVRVHLHVCGRSAYPEREFPVDDGGANVVLRHFFAVDAMLPLSALWRRGKNAEILPQKRFVAVNCGAGSERLQKRIITVIKAYSFCYDDPEVAYIIHALPPFGGIMARFAAGSNIRLSRPNQPGFFVVAHRMVGIVLLLAAGLAWLIFDDIHSGQAYVSAFYTADRATAPRRFWMTVAANAALLCVLIFQLIQWLI